MIFKNFKQLIESIQKAQSKKRVAVVAAQIKGYESPVTGDADILILPNMTTGNKFNLYKEKSR